MSHFIEKCKHGKVVSQCRCIGQDKSIRIVKCPASCPTYDPISTRSEYESMVHKRDLVYQELYNAENLAESIRRRYNELDSVIFQYEEEQDALDE